MRNRLIARAVFSAAAAVASFLLISALAVALPRQADRMISSATAITPTAAGAEPCPPVILTTFTGTVTIDGQPAPDGTLISAVGMDGVTWATTTTSGGTYLMDVPETAPVTEPCFPGGTISFACDGISAPETGEASGDLRELNLTCDSAATPVPTPTPTPTPTPMPPPPTPTPTPTPTPPVPPPPTPTPTVIPFTPMPSPTPTPTVIPFTPMPSPTPTATPALEVEERMLSLEWPRRMRPTETKHVILTLADVAATPEQPEATGVAEVVVEPEQWPGHYLYGIATLRAKLNCEPACNNEMTKRVAEGDEVEWRWVLGPNPELEGKQHAKVDFRWCFKEKENDRLDPCTPESSVVFDKAFDIDVASGSESLITIPFPNMYLWLVVFAGVVVNVARVIRSLREIFEWLQAAVGRLRRWAGDVRR